MTKNIIIGVLVVTTLIFGALYFSLSGKLGAAGIGPTHYQAENFLQGLFAGTTGQFRVTNSGAVTVGNGSSTTKIIGATGTWDPEILAVSETATTSVSAVGLVAGDPCIAGLSTASSSAGLGVIFGCQAISTTEFLVSVLNTSGTQDIVSGDVSVLQFQF